MIPAREPPERRDDVRLVVAEADGTVVEAGADELPRFLRPGDVLVVNDAATLPASLVTADGAVEVRLAGVPGTWSAALTPPLSRVGGPSLAHAPDTWPAVLLGAGDWRTPTEDRPPPPPLATGDRLSFAPGVTATITAVSPLSPRLVALHFPDAWRAIYRHGRPVQYAHVPAPLDLWSVQTVYAGRPWSAEMPSAGRPLTAATLLALAGAGVRVVPLTHGASLSATGDAALDAARPFPERYDVPRPTLDAVLAARRVVAVGTTVVRALETVAATGRLCGVTDLVIDARHRPRLVDGVLSGLHGPGESHHRLLSAFADPARLDAALGHAAIRGLHTHELGDLLLVSPAPTPTSWGQETETSAGGMLPHGARVPRANRSTSNDAALALDLLPLDAPWMVPP